MMEKKKARKEVFKPKKVMSFRFTEEIRALIKEIAKIKKISKTEVVEIAIRWAFE